MYKLVNDDCFVYMAALGADSITAIVTDPPYGIREYTSGEVEKMKSGHGGIWRIPQSFGGCTRKPVPRFSVINDDPKERKAVYEFFLRFGKLANRVLVPGGHVILASTPLLSDIVSIALRDSGLERRGEIVRSVCTLRGGDRPKGAEKNYLEMSVMPRGVCEPWELFRKPIETKTVAENIEKWGAGSLRRPAKDIPFSDYIESGKPTRVERAVSKHPSLKPQSFMRKIVRASLPTGKGVVLDPFSGSGSTIAAAEFLGYESVGVEIDKDFYLESVIAVPKLSKIVV